MLVLEGAQSGLSWSTILHRRAGYRRAFAGFDPDRGGPVRGRPTSTGWSPIPASSATAARSSPPSQNAKAVLGVREQHGSLDAYLWGLVPDAPSRGRRGTTGEIPAETPESRALSKELRRQGFRFLGPTTCYAFMQAVGMVNDHIRECFRYDLGGA